MERIDLLEPEISRNMDSPPGSPKENLHIQSLLHAVSNKEKIRTAAGINLVVALL